jgi:hydrogenase maturation protein HypF
MYIIFVQGIVQGVGFRPYIYRKAVEHNLVGYVKNTGNGVEICINDKDFINKLTDLPPLANITHHTIKKLSEKQIFTDFSILKSTSAQGQTDLPADIFMCQDCEAELHDPRNRRYQYYFITCTNCGPRFSMIHDYPYDRPLTSMNEFSMCPQCQKEYTNPLDRRYHAQTIACKDCGPKLKLLYHTKDISGKTDIKTIQKAIEIIQTKQPISIKGVGGFHICSLCDAESTQRVRQLLHRQHKPFAILAEDIAMAEKIADISDKEKELLTSPQRPIVVVQKKQINSFNEVSELDSIGIMLPYTALHYLLFHYIDDPLLMTSCNIPGEPVSTTETICEYFLTHERKIINRCDDSVLKVIKNNINYLRRSRGYTPLPIPLPLDCVDTIAFGSEINNAICCSKQKKAYLSQYIGDCSKYETSQFLKDTIRRFIILTRLKPKMIVCDLHPNYTSTAYAKELSEKYNVSLTQIQHHKAHVASVAGEHCFTEYVGIAIDGLGYGEDKSLWGGEVFNVSNTTFKRIGHLEQQPQIGGDSATIYPKKMLFGILSKIIDEEKLLKTGLFTHKETQLYLKMLENNFNVSQTSSMGRVLDAVSVLLGLVEKRTYEGRPAMLLESAATKPYTIEPEVSTKKGKHILLTTPLFEFLLNNRKKDTGRLAATAQTYLAKGIYDIAKKQAKQSKPIVASGGVCYNKMITSYLIKNKVFMHKQLPCGDGCISYGQTIIANMKNK